MGRKDIDWDFGFNSPSSGAPIRVGDELWFYYSGRSYRHPVDGQSREPNKGAIGLAKLRLDGFVSMDAGSQEGTLTTRPLVFRNPGLLVNAEASNGEIRVEVVGADGRPLPGFSRADCEVVRSDSVRHRITWKGNQNLAAFAGRPVQLKFYLRNASLYSFALGAEE